MFVAGLAVAVVFVAAEASAFLEAVEVPESFVLENVEVLFKFSEFAEIDCVIKFSS